MAEMTEGKEVSIPVPFGCLLQVDTLGKVVDVTSIVGRIFQAKDGDWYVHVTRKLSKNLNNKEVSNRAFYKDLQAKHYADAYAQFVLTAHSLIRHGYLQAQKIKNAIIIRILVSVSI